MGDQKQICEIWIVPIMATTITLAYNRTKQNLLIISVLDGLLREKPIEFLFYAEFEKYCNDFFIGLMNERLEKNGCLN